MKYRFEKQGSSNNIARVHQNILKILLPRLEKTVRMIQYAYTTSVVATVLSILLKRSLARVCVCVSADKSHFLGAAAVQNYI